MKTEQDVIDACKIAASVLGWRLWRNNSGAGRLENGKFIRWGLANESVTMNTVIKSSDLIGIKPVVITPEMVGTTIGVFVAIECKRYGWNKSADAHVVAQERFLDMVNTLGGIGVFNSTGLLK